MLLVEYLNQTLTFEDTLKWCIIVITVWVIIWYLFLGRLLEKCDYDTIGHTIYEFGPIGSIMMLVVIGIVLIMIITIIQLIIKGGM